jgi:hypothetical protein
MKNKPFLIFFAFLLFFLFTGSNQSLFAAQTDFYGTWACKVTEDDVSLIIRFIISESSMGMEVEVVLGKGRNPYVEREDFEITEWSAIENPDRSTKADYPDGFSFHLSMDGGETIEIYISKDKRRFIVPELNEDHEDLIIFRKQ